MLPIPRFLIVFAAIVAILCSIAVVGIVASNQDSEKIESRIERLSLSQLENRLRAIDQQLISLAKPSMRMGVGAIGYRSIPQFGHAQTEWIRISLAGEESIDQVVLVPTIWRDTEKGFRADGFPVEFSIRVGQEHDEEGTLIASYDLEDHLLPRVAPVVVTFPARKASWVRLEATMLSPRGWDGQHVLQLSEIFVFAGQENVALGQPVEVSSSDSIDHGVLRQPDYLVDGFVPYVMDAAEGEQSLAYVSGDCRGSTPIVQIDLQEHVPINCIHLHAVDLSDNVPQSHPSDFGIPRLLVVEGASQPDYSDAVKLIEFRKESVYDVGPIIMGRFQEVMCRYIRLVVKEPSVHMRHGKPRAQFGFSEIEVLSNGENRALAKPLSVNIETDDSNRMVSTLNDGNNLFGKILPLRRWINELSLRHDLETERPLVIAELGTRYRQQKTNLVRLSWLAVALGFVTVCTVLIERIVRQRAIIQTRERIAADLHDELGANLHAIGLLGDLAQMASESPDRLKSLLQRIRTLTELSGAATRNCSNMLESRGLSGNLAEELKRTSSRLMTDLDHKLFIEGDEFVRQVKPRDQIDVVLFYKECLTNVLRHSHASRVVTRLTANRNGLSLIVSDNGCGLSESHVDRVPTSLSRRARFLGAHVSATEPVDGGTTITLRIRNKKFGLI